MPYTLTLRELLFCLTINLIYVYLLVINCINICILLVTSRSDPPEGAGDCRAEAEDSRGDGRDAEPVVFDRHH